MPLTEDPDARLKATDGDRWLATRFIDDAAARAEIVALYALDLELAAIPGRATNPLMGEIRLAWWRERLEALAAGGAGGEHPLLGALAASVATGRFPLAPLVTLIEARHAELADPWFEDEAGLDQYLEDLDVGLAGVVTRRLSGDTEAGTFNDAARLAGLGRLMRRPAAADGWPAWWPQTWRKLAEDDGRNDAVLRHLGHKLEALRSRARAAPRLAPAAFPAIAHAVLATDQRSGPVLRRARMLAAVTTGRI